MPSIESNLRAHAQAERDERVSEFLKPSEAEAAKAGGSGSGLLPGYTMLFCAVLFMFKGYAEPSTTLILISMMFGFAALLCFLMGLYVSMTGRGQ